MRSRRPKGDGGGASRKAKRRPPSPESSSPSPSPRKSSEKAGKKRAKDEADPDKCPNPDTSDDEWVDKKGSKTSVLVCYKYCTKKGCPDGHTCKYSHRPKYCKGEGIFKKK